MFKNKSIAAVIPAYNEENLIGKVIETMPEFVDLMIIINDRSTDKTRERIDSYIEKGFPIQLIDHEVNKGLGQSLIDGYLAAIEAGSDVIVVMAGDAQMSPADLPAILLPVCEGQVDYTKGNRLLRADAYDRMPRHRFFGNSVLSLLTKFATGYWQLIDPQSGYTAISNKALASIPIEKMIKGYGYNAHILNMLNMANYRVMDVEIEPVYGDEVSTIKLHKYIPGVTRLLLSLFVGRVIKKYLIRDFHPLVFFYMFSLFNGLFLALPLLVRFIYKYHVLGYMPQTTLILLTFCSTMAMFSLFFAMSLDMEDNRRLQPVNRPND